MEHRNNIKTYVILAILNFLTQNSIIQNKFLDFQSMHMVRAINFQLLFKGQICYLYLL